MTKQDQFLWIVQTAFLANAVNLASLHAEVDSNRHIFSATGALINADEALRASKMIPASFSVFEAAHEFCTFMFENLRDLEDSSRSVPLQTPSWFARN
jgi:hypothetical protein